MRGWPFASPAEAWSWASALQNCEEANACCFSPHVPSQYLVRGSLSKLIEQGNDLVLRTVLKAANPS